MGKRLIYATVIQ